MTTTNRSTDAGQGPTWSNTIYPFDDSAEEMTRRFGERLRREHAHVAAEILPPPVRNLLQQLAKIAA